MGFLKLPITIPRVFSPHPKLCRGFSQLTLNHAYRNTFPLHSHMWFLAYHKPTLQSGFWLTTNLQLQSGFKITTTFIGVHILHVAYITHSNPWSYQIHTLQRPQWNILDFVTNECIWHIIHHHLESIPQSDKKIQLVVHHPKYLYKTNIPYTSNLLSTTKCIWSIFYFTSLIIVLNSPRRLVSPSILT